MSTPVQTLHVLCEGEQDSQGPSCDGPDVQLVVYQNGQTWDIHTAHWCKDCRLQAEHLGHTIYAVIKRYIDPA